MRYRKIVWLLALVPLTALCMRLWENGDGLSRARTRAVKAPAISAAFQCYSNGVGGHTLGEACVKTEWQVQAYCLMRNHFHLVLEPPQPNLVFGMKWLLGVYRSTRR
jgi:hypothetical protein